LQSTILIGQVNIPSWGQLGCTQVPRPFLLTAKDLVARVISSTGSLDVYAGVHFLEGSVMAHFSLIEQE